MARLVAVPFWVLFLVTTLALTACDGTKRYPARGVVREVLAEEGQAMIAHENIEGLMPAMTMNFSVYDREALAKLEPGDVVEFDLVSERGGFWIETLKVVSKVEPGDGWVALGDTLVEAEAAPAFALVDQNGAPLALADLAGKTLLLDFIFTQCPGPCPILTSRLVAVERALPAELRDRTRFVSISIDPQNDTPEALAQYGLDRGADLDHWSFLTGPEDVVAEVLVSYGVGTTLGEDGSLEHVLVTFLIDGEGRIVKRYLGVDTPAAEIGADLQSVAAPTRS